MSDQQLPAAAVMIQYRIADFDAWKAVFDGAEEKRAASGFVGSHINRGEDDPNELAIYLAVADVDAAQAYMDDPELRALMQQAGALTPPEIAWMQPVREAVVWDRELPAMVVSHHVDDFDTWLDAYDGAGEMQREGGIIGHAANRSIDDPSLVVVYHQAESFDELKSFASADELKAAMKEASVSSDPEFSFWTGGYGVQY